MSLTALLVQRNIRSPQNIDRMSTDAVAAFLAEFNITVAEGHRVPAAKVAVSSAMISPNADVAAIAKSVYRRFPEVVPVADVQDEEAPVQFKVGPCVASLGFYDAATTVEVVPVIPEVQPEEAVTGTRRRGESAFDRAVAMLDNAGTLTREAQVALLLANEYNKSSANVYVWKYNKGERS